MNFKSSSLAVATCAFSVCVNAATVTQGFLSSDDTTNIITDSLNNVEYLRLNVLADLNYAETLNILNTQDGGGWSIASSSVAVDFATSLFGGSAACSHNGSNVVVSACGALTGWYDGKFGNSYDSLADTMWFLDDTGEADFLRIRASDSYTALYDYTLLLSEAFSQSGTPGGSLDIPWLVSRTTVVPVPAAVWLFGSGLLGLVGLARRKKAK